MKTTTEKPIYLTSFQGPKGDRGIDGIHGKRGFSGDNGKKGEKGEMGRVGDKVRFFYYASTLSML